VYILYANLFAAGFPGKYLFHLADASVPATVLWRSLAGSIPFYNEVFKYKFMGFAQQIYVVFCAIFLFGLMLPYLWNSLHGSQATHFCIELPLGLGEKFSSCLYVS